VKPFLAVVVAALLTLAAAVGQAETDPGAALVGTLFGVEPDAVPTATLSGAARARVEAYNRCLAGFRSQIQVGALPEGPERWLAEKRQRVERGLVCLVGGAGIEERAAAYARDAELLYEWEGMSEGPLAEAGSAERYLGAHPGTPLEPYLHLFAAHRYRSAAEALTAEGDAGGNARAAEAYGRHLRTVQGEQDPLTRLAAAGLERLPFVYLVPPQPPVTLPSAAPPLPLRQALDGAEAWLRDQGWDSSGQYLHSASLEYDDSPDSRGLYWRLSFAWVEPRLGGELELRVDMDGSVSGRRLGP
jgi:hypothetical protein